MNYKQKFHSVMNYEQNTDIPVVHFGYWYETVDKWKEEGHIDTDDWGKVSAKLGFDFEYGDCFGFGIANVLHPQFEPEVIEKFPDGSVHERNYEGVIELRKPGIVSIPTEIGHTLTDRASWEEHYLPKLQFSKDRYDFANLKQQAERDAPIGIYGGSLYGVLRNWFGVVGLSYITVDDEELYDEMIAVLANLSYDLLKYALEKASSMGVKFDYIHFWEDICFKTGPLVNPSVFAEKVGPYYKRITDLGKEHGIKIFSLDCDGLIDDLLPIWLENGVNTMFPIEVGTWEASIAPWREKYGKKCLGIGGMNKSVFAYDFKAIDAEIERLKPLVELGGFIPCPDHRIAPDAKWDNVRYYCDKMHKVFS